MMTDRESEAYRQAIEVMARAVFDSEVVGPLDALVDEQPVRDIVTTGLDALLAPSRVTCTTCGGTRLLCYPSGGVNEDDPCPDCSDGTVEGPPVICRVLGMEQVGWMTPGMASGPNLGSLLDGKFSTLDVPVYRVSDTRGPK